MSQIISITSRDYWFKVVGMLQQNWALIDEISPGIFKELSWSLYRKGISFVRADKLLNSA